MPGSPICLRIEFVPSCPADACLWNDWNVATCRCSDPVDSTLVPRGEMCQNIFDRPEVMCDGPKQLLLIQLREQGDKMVMPDTQFRYQEIFRQYSTAQRILQTFVAGH